MSDTELERSTIHMVRLHFVPLLFTCFVIAFLDRVNVGFAALTMNKDIVMLHNTVTSSGALPAQTRSGRDSVRRECCSKSMDLGLGRIAHST